MIKNSAYFTDGKTEALTCTISQQMVFTASTLTQSESGFLHTCSKMTQHELLGHLNISTLSGSFWVFDEREVGVGRERRTREGGQMEERKRWRRKR